MNSHTEKSGTLSQYLLCHSPKMGFFSLSNATLFSLLLLLVAASSTLANADQHYYVPHPALAPSPTPHHHLHHHHHPHSPSPAPIHTTPTPAKPPTPPPAKPPTSYPTPTPTKPPTHPSKPPTSYHPLPRKLVAVQGVVYCKNCSYVGVDTLLGASPLADARVVLRCRNTKYLLKETATTDKNGYFFMEVSPLITTYGTRKCHVSLSTRSRHAGNCSKPTNLHGGATGAPLVLDRKAQEAAKSHNFTIFTVGPFAYEPLKCYKH